MSDDEAVLRLALALLAVRGTGGSSTATVRPDLPAERFAAAGFRTGLSAAVGAWADDAGVALPGAWRPWLDDQRAAVAARQARFAAARRVVLTALHDAGVAATPVKGAVLSVDGWPRPEARPMADLDLLVPPAQRDAAGRALVAAGLPHVASAPWEDTFLAWPGEEPLRLDGESPGHPGKVEVHPGWVERLHDYLVDDGGTVTGRAAPGELDGAPCRRLDPVGFAAHVVGHLAACVVRADARALHVVDAAVVLDGVGPDGRAELADLWAHLDPRLSAPALWLVGAVHPDPALGALAAGPLDRLGPAGRRALADAAPADVLRGGRPRTTFAWRQAFARTVAERAHVTRQLVVPGSSDAAGGGHVAVRQVRRLVRVARRAGHRPA